MPVVPIETLKPHPENARTGDIAAIMGSLKAHGQYRPIVADQDGTILAGHHVVQAALALGWTTIDVHTVTVDPETARGIMVADNRMSDLATYDTGALVELLHALDNLDGTGFDLDELGQLEDDLLTGLSTGGAPRPEATDENVKIRVGKHAFHVQPDPYATWRAALIEEAGTPKAARKILIRRLGFPDATPSPKPQTVTDETPTADVSSTPMEQVPCAELVPFPGNPRQGDIGAISASLQRFGQYRPLVITQDNTVLVGNHTLAAALALGWNRLDVVRVHVDPEEAAKIVLVDNRTADLAGYDDESLHALLASLSTFTGTGFDLDDVHDILAGGSTRPTKSPRRVTAAIGDIKFSVHRDQYTEWETGLTLDAEVDIAERLGFALDACVL